jgi:hypothetical protein
VLTATTDKQKPRRTHLFARLPRNGSAGTFGDTTSHCLVAQLSVGSP